MANPAWPVGVEYRPRKGTFTFEPVDDVVRGPADVGGGPRRQRFLGRATIYRGTIPANQAQCDALMAFFEDDCARGAFAFDMTDWRTLLTTPVVAEFTWHEPPKPRHRVGLEFDIPLVLFKLD